MATVKLLFWIVVFCVVVIKAGFIGPLIGAAVFLLVAAPVAIYYWLGGF